MAIAERRLAAEFNRPGHDIVDHRTYVIARDGDLQEGVASEASSLAGHLRLGKLDRPLRRQPDPARRADGLGVQRGRARAVRRLRLAHAAGRGRHRRRGDRRRHRRRQGRRAAVDHRRPDPHRLRQPEQAGHAEGARRAARPRRGPPHQGGLRLGPGQDVLRARTRRASCSAARSTRARTWSPSGSRGSTRYADGVPGRGRGAASGGSPAGCPTAGTRACRRTRSAPRSRRGTRARTRSRRSAGVAARSCSAGRRTCRSRTSPTSRRTATDHFEADHAGRNLRFGVREHGMGAIANGIAYHGGFLPYCATFLTFSDYMRGSVRLASLSGLHVDLRLDPRLGRPRRGRADAPAGRALRGAPRDPEPVVRAAGRRQRGGRGLGARGRAAGDPGRAAGPGRARVHAPEAADAGGLAGARPRGPAARRLRAARGRAAGRPS